MEQMRATGERMDAQREAAIMEAAVEHYGVEAQMIKTMEELGELTQAVARVLLWGNGEDELENLREEMADVSIMLSQLELIFGDVAEVEEYKLLRLEQRVKEDEK